MTLDLEMVQKRFLTLDLRKRGLGAALLLFKREHFERIGETNKKVREDPTLKFKRGRWGEKLNLKNEGFKNIS